jgi:AraC family transcriptional regulator
MPLAVCGGHGTVLDELPIAGGVRAVRVAHPPGMALTTHAHDTTKLCVVLAGGVTERHGIDIVAPRPFDVLLRPAHSSHENQYHAVGARSLVVELDPRDPRVRALPPLDEVAVALALGDAGARLAGARGARELEAAVTSTLTQLAAACRPLPRWLRAARERLVERLADPPSLGDLARTVGIHPVHLAQTFRTRYGLTIRRFVRLHRVFRAQELVARRPLAAIAAEVGFADQSHMTRAFRAERQAPPGAIRELVDSGHTRP